jgi:hypothetical protein
MNIGDPIILSVSLYDQAPDMYVRAILRADGIVMPQSPINLVHIGNGTYFYKNLSTLIFPTNTFDVRVQYIVYDDSNYTTASVRYETAEDIFRLSTSVPYDSPQLIEKIDNLISIVSSHDLNSEIVGEIVDSFELLGAVQDEDVVGYLDDQVNLIGDVLDESQIDGTMSEEQILEGLFDL